MDETGLLSPGITLKELGDKQLDMLKFNNLLFAAAKSEVLVEKLSSIKLPEEDTQKIWKDYLSSINLEDDNALEMHLKRQGINRDGLRWNLELPQRVKIYCNEHFSHKSEEHFLKRKEGLDRVIYSLLRVKDGYLARELYLRISGGEVNFAEVAAQYSQGQEAKTKGIVGPLPLNQSHPTLCEKLRTSKPGELLEPFSVENWWLVVRLERFEPARFEESTAEAMAQELFQEWLSEEVTCKLSVL